MIRRKQTENDDSKILLEIITPSVTILQHLGNTITHQISLDLIFYDRHCRKNEVFAISLPRPIRHPKNGKSAADNKSNKSNILENASRQIRLITVLMAGLSLDN